MPTTATVENRTYNSTNSKHAEELMFGSGRHNNDDLNVDLSAWPCTGERGHNCHALFILKSNARIIRVTITGDHGGYAANHGHPFGSTGVITYNNGDITTVLDAII